ncbi:MAG TPA: shikimate kinase [Bacteroidales bacterium]|nr:shikimate kinase [Bacteroidales bacterium]HSA43315.1 shikimate kinase [Bacteroidales bacterium]
MENSRQYVPKVFLIGFMGSGKSATGLRLARELGYTHYDTDAVFEETHRFTIPSFFETFGEEAFRRIEHNVLMKTASMDQVVVSTGGGTPCFHDNMAFILKHGRSVYLRLDWEHLMKRLLQSRKPRPLIRNTAKHELEQNLEALLKSRESVYRQANHTLDISGLTLTGVIDRLLPLLVAV